MNQGVKIVLTGAAAFVAGLFVKRQVQKYKTIHDIKPPVPVPGMETWDPSKLGSLQHADTTAHRQKLVAARPLSGGRAWCYRPDVAREVDPASIDCPTAIGI